MSFVLIYTNLGKIYEFSLISTFSSVFRLERVFSQGCVRILVHANRCSLQGWGKGVFNTNSCIILRSGWNVVCLYFYYKLTFLGMQKNS